MNAIESPQTYEDMIADGKSDVFREPIEISGIIPPPELYKDQYIVEIARMGAKDVEDADRRYQELLPVYAFAHNAYADSREPTRLTGEETIYHSLRIAYMLAGSGITDLAVLKAVFLHDVPEDTIHTIEDVRKLFGDEVATLVDVVTPLKLKNLESDEGGTLTDKEKDKKNLGKILEAFTRDYRAIYIKLADVADNALTYRAYRNRDKRIRKANLALRYYEPLARRLGLDAIARIIGNSAFKVIQPAEYNRISKMRQELNMETIVRQLNGQIGKWENDAFAKDKKHPLISRVINIYTPNNYEVSQLASKTGVKPEHIFPRINIICDHPNDAQWWEGYFHENNLLVRNGSIVQSTDFYEGPVYEHMTVELTTGHHGIDVILTTSSHEVLPTNLDIAGDSLKMADRDRAEAKLEALKDFYRSAVSDGGSTTEEMAEGLERGIITAIAEQPNGDKYSFAVGSTTLDFAYRMGPNLGHRAKRVITDYLGDVLCSDDLDTPLFGGVVVQVLTDDDTGNKELSISPDRFDLVRTRLAQRYIREQLGRQLDSRRAKERTIHEAWLRGGRIIQWLYEHQSNNSLDVHMEYGFDDRLREQYSSIDKLRAQLGFIQLPIPTKRTPSLEREELYATWVRAHESEDEIIRKNAPLTHDAVVLVENLIRFRHEAPRLRVKLSRDKIGVLASISEVLLRQGYSVMPVHGIPDHLSRGKKPVILTYVLAEGPRTQSQIDILKRRLKKTLGNKVVITIEKRK